ncbi:MAG: DedA family protein [Thermoproteota archaeon]|nr:DedA family protein [Thermoproteota archaeon]
MLIDTITSWISAYGYAGVFLAMLIETVFPPIPSEVVLPLAGYAVFNNQGGIIDAIIVGIIAGLGSTVGAIVIYLVARKIGRYAVIKYGKYIFLDEKKLAKIEEWFDRHGTKAVFLCRMAPGMRELISIPAGLSKMSIPKFTVFTFAGSLIWSVSLTIVGYTFGKTTQNWIESSSAIFNYVAIIIIVGIVGYIVYRFVKSSVRTDH